MSLRPGTRLGPYEIGPQIGAGGMGEVFRATDVHLKRGVAIKILPASLANDPDRLARFRREAEVLAALNHPNIAQIHGLEKSEAGSALVMELVEGLTLADRIAAGPLPLNEALDVAAQIAAGLEAAHGQGIIHRDLKPSNIKVRPDGTVKILDFGLAKAIDPVQTADAHDIANSPTITSPAMTEAGMILGTAAYMSPEQARGRPVDRRADIWAFGCVLFELLSGRRAFDDEDTSLTLSRVLQREPAWDSLPGDVPPRIRRTLELCLRKDVRERIADIHDVRLALDGAFETLAAPPPSRRRRIGPLVTAACLVSAAIAGASVWIATRPNPPAVTRLSIPTGGETALSASTVSRDVVITPDGSRVIYRAGGDIVVRALDDVRPNTLTGLGSPYGLFLSPDGQWVGFSSGGELRKVATTGGAPVPVAKLDAGLRGATWSSRGSMVFATASGTGLLSVPAEGGAITTLTTPDASRGEADHLWPEFLPDGRALVFTITAPAGGLNAGQIAVLDLDTRQVTILPLRGTRARYASSGHLVYGVNGALHAVAFDLARRVVTGTPVSVLTPGPILVSGDMQLDVAANGTLVYLTTFAAQAGPRSIVWVDRQGREEPLSQIPPRPYVHPQLSRDGTRLMLSDVGQGDIWAVTLSSPTLYRITDDPASDLSSTWLADGRVMFASNRTGAYRLHVQSASGGGDATIVKAGAATQIAPAALADGTGVVFTEVTAAARGGVRLLTLKTGEVTTLVDTRSDERGGLVSPDGRWLAFESNRSDRYEVYVQRFPAADADGFVPVSGGGGVQPRWSQDGKELFYVSPDGALMAVAVQTSSSSWSASPPVRLFEGRFATRDNQAVVAAPQYDTRDGQRFLMLKTEGSSSGTSGSTEIIVVQNWLEELRRLAPTN